MPLQRMKKMVDDFNAKLSEWHRSAPPPLLGQWTLVDVLNDVIVVKVEVGIRARACRYPHGSVLCVWSGASGDIFEAFDCVPVTVVHGCPSSCVVKPPSLSCVSRS
jgi:hypothetical protein